jgi:hypothetical protein
MSVVLLPFGLVCLSVVDYYYTRSTFSTLLAILGLNIFSTWALLVTGLGNGLAGRRFSGAEYYDKAMICNGFIYIYCVGKLIYLLK